MEIYTKQTLELQKSKTRGWEKQADNLSQSIKLFMHSYLKTDCDVGKDKKYS